MLDNLDAENVAEVFKQSGVVTVGDDVVLTHDLVGKVRNIVKLDLKSRKLGRGLGPACLLPLAGGLAEAAYHMHIILAVDRRL